MTRESDLYLPVKALFERQGYVVKGEVGAADLVARRGDEPPVVVELKLVPSLRLYLQAVARLSVADHVYVAILRPGGRSGRRRLTENLHLCRRIGLGLIVVDAEGRPEVLCDPGAGAPRRNARGAARLLREFETLRGDPNAGGATRRGIVTAYRQDALACAAHLAETGTASPRDVRAATGIARAGGILSDNHYGWFERVSRGVYALTDAGHAGLADWTARAGVR
ncbi:DUF2161 domain-containing phosphodiesterase [Roseivivax isoporae]|uniref:DUF2161 domain-containing phosphodiesterase n=1 Tax=Roseivivax isoporae LMG 25204 TaxID=1449351 RepID=X7FDG7_9RHOB|nr:DUF2161 family putative PD-(D/E)XK-type phosphodiesterase [Roseivivax isoporae]ETX30106.1 hypothetical protein RISW2_18105 [Roseivivax isoporae LMG 25204]